MKVKKEYMILLAIIIVLAVYLILSGGKNKMSYRPPELEKIPDETINMIEITRTEMDIMLNREDEIWKIMPQAYPADPVKVKDILEVIQDLTLTELAAEKKDYQRYELDNETKISVRAYESDRLAREFDLGKTSPTYKHTFVRLREDSRVFYARGSFRSKFELEIDDLRDKSVLTFDKNAVTEINITKEGKTLTFAKRVLPVETKPAEDKEEVQPPQVSEEEAWVMPSGERGKKSEIDSIVSQMADLRCDEFIEDKSKEDFKGSVCTVTIKGANEYTLRIFPKEDKEDGKYPAISSENPYAFLLSTYRAESLMKKPEDLVESQAKE